MKVQGSVVVQARQADVWNALNDPEVLKKATPGCKVLKEVTPDTYHAEIVLGIAAVRGAYDAEIKLFDKAAPNSYRLQMKADSKMGFIEGNALVELEHSNSNTTIKYDGEAKVGGLIAGVGQRILSGIAKMIVKDFFKKIAAETKTKELT